ncbi:MAG: DUF4166 domain-containing protein [Hyphomicrobiaceae bacterium]
MSLNRSVNIKSVEAATGPPARTTRPGTSQPLGDLRFRQILGSTAWHALPAAIRDRFSKRLEGGRTVVYVGRTTDMRMNRAGVILTQLARIIGGPLPLSRDVDVPSVVTVTEDIASGGQIWTRLYAHRKGFPQVIHSSKRFAGPTGLEEHVGCGVGMTLTLAAHATALIFESARYFLQVGMFRLYIPRWLSPGHLTIGHHEIDAQRFAFTLDLKHPLFGHLIHQRAEFTEAQ